MKFIALSSGLVLNLDLIAAIRPSPAPKCLRLLFPAPYTSQSAGRVFGQTPLTLAWMDLDEADTQDLLRALREQGGIGVDLIEKAIVPKAE
jgi:hypothetical protein